MAKIGKVFDSFKKGIELCDKYSAKIQSAISHGKSAVEKGKQFLDSEDGKATLGFIKDNFSKNNSPENENNNKESNISEKQRATGLDFTTVLNAVNKAKEIYDEDVKETVASFQEKNECSINISESEENEKTDEPIEKEERAVEPQVMMGRSEETTDTFFEDKRDELLDAAKQGVMNLHNPEEVLSALCKLQSVANETIKYAEEQETKRVEIIAKKDVAIEKIKVIESCIKDYLEKTFDERRSIFEKQFECVDSALKTGNLELLALSLNSINSLAAQSPFKALADVVAVQKNLLDTNTEWDI